MRELDAFEARVGTSASDLARSSDRGLLREDATARRGRRRGCRRARRREPQASMVRARAAADARLALANRRGEWTDASSEEGDAEPDSRRRDESPEA